MMSAIRTAVSVAITIAGTEPRRRHRPSVRPMAVLALRDALSVGCAIHSDAFNEISRMRLRFCLSRGPITVTQEDFRVAGARATPAAFFQYKSNTPY